MTIYWLYYYLLQQEHWFNLFKWSWNASCSAIILLKTSACCFSHTTVRRPSNVDCAASRSATAFHSYKWHCKFECECHSNLSLVLVRYGAVAAATAAGEAKVASLFVANESGPEAEAGTEAGTDAGTVVSQLISSATKDRTATTTINASNFSWMCTKNRIVWECVRVWVCACVNVCRLIHWKRSSNDNDSDRGRGSPNKRTNNAVAVASTSSTSTPTETAGSSIPRATITWHAKLEERVS